MTYAKAWDVISNATYEQAEAEGWLSEYEIASEHVRIADFDYSAGTISSVNDYDEDK